MLYGRFVGKDGFHDVCYDLYTGGYEIGYPLCKQCLDLTTTKKGWGKVMKAIITSVPYNRWQKHWMNKRTRKEGRKYEQCAI
jgi:hypothetical protein